MSGPKCHHIRTHNVIPEVIPARDAPPPRPRQIPVVIEALEVKLSKTMSWALLSQISELLKNPSRNVLHEWQTVGNRTSMVQCEIEISQADNEALREVANLKTKYNVTYDLERQVIRMEVGEVCTLTESQQSQREKIVAALQRELVQKVNNMENGFRAYAVRETLRNIGAPVERNWPDGSWQMTYNEQVTQQQGV